MRALIVAVIFVLMVVVYGLAGSDDLETLCCARLESIGSLQVVMR